VVVAVPEGVYTPLYLAIQPGPWVREEAIEAWEWASKLPWRFVHLSSEVPEAPADGSHGAHRQWSSQLGALDSLAAGLPQLVASLS
jgi:hypothetical protein